MFASMQYSIHAMLYCTTVQYTIKTSAFMRITQKISFVLYSQWRNRPPMFFKINSQPDCSEWSQCSECSLCSQCSEWSQWSQCSECSQCSPISKEHSFPPHTRHTRAPRIPWHSQKFSSLTGRRSWPRWRALRSSAPSISCGRKQMKWR